ncbi:type II toxin-antitoxin system CcdA family antitoxin [Amycolatopsis rhabdoformis]|uniref:Type II toxin-antitoxin system CcdA family antitoxin n=1 Tax=Amycolatopsis rhabdoformis TaxID=1448059 RepID=A0ABZ1I5A0_9PSEU|nr:type II toxin-antitoxin system CcdA family antitoxin [Amycolatopsis rhabdoformis]WSE28952.1 type II toxin-antitoxin system CcdA family antitoxin [Amycolatopsis rhabdoformis]
MARVNVYIPDDLAERAKAAELNVSALVQAALADALQRRATESWLDALPTPRGVVSHGAVLAALDNAKAELGDSVDD